jgi:hypothetical protein
LVLLAARFSRVVWVDVKKSVYPGLLVSVSVVGETVVAKTAEIAELTLQKWVQKKCPVEGNEQ